MHGQYRHAVSVRLKTHEENGLHVLEEVCPLSARVVVNQVSMKMENERIRKLIEDLRRVLQEEM